MCGPCTLFDGWGFVASTSSGLLLFLTQQEQLKFHLLCLCCVPELKVVRVLTPLQSTDLRHGDVFRVLPTANPCCILDEPPSITYSGCASKQSNSKNS